MQFDLSNYPEVCLKCGSPARTELNVHDYPVGVDWWQYCINFKCIQFDGSNLKEHRERLERMVRESKPFRRHQKKLWKQYGFVYRREQKRVRALTTHQ